MITVHPDTQALLFDCDGTLADTMPLHNKAWMDTFEAEGLTYPAQFFYERMGMSSRHIIQDYNRLYSQSLDAERVSLDKMERVMKFLAEADPIEPVVSIARRWHGEKKMAVISGGAELCVRTTLKALDLEHLFPVVITADDHLPPKPAPDKFLEGARRLGVDPGRCQVFEDADAGLAAARAAGMMATDVREWL